jgi:thioredoxin-like negative regulator of GroEL
MSCCSTNKSSLWPLLVIVLALGAVMYVRGRTAPTPPMFDEAVTLQTALEQSDETGKPIFVLATADWCPGCQSLKRGALMDDELVAAIRDRAIIVYLDATSDTSPGSVDAGRLGVRALPTMILIDDGKEISRTTGARSASNLLAWFDKAVPQGAVTETSMEPGIESVSESAGEG